MATAIPAEVHAGTGMNRWMAFTDVQGLRRQIGIAANLDAYRNPMPRGPRKNLRDVPVSQSQPMAATSTGIWPTLWQASSK